MELSTMKPTAVSQIADNSTYDMSDAMKGERVDKFYKYTIIILIILVILFVIIITILFSVTITSINTNNRLISIIENASTANSQFSNEGVIASVHNTSTNENNNTEQTCNQTGSIYLSSKPNEALKLWHHSLPNRILPGVQFLSYSFNQLQGSPPTDLILQGNYRQIIEFTYLEQRVSSGSDDFLIPDQLDLPSISGVCSKESSTTSVSSSTSTSSMYSESAEATGQKSFSASVSASGWGSSLSGSVAMSSSYSNSRSSTASKQYARSGKTSSSYTYSKALLYSTQLRWDTIDSYRDEFISAINNIANSNDNDINKNVMLFFGDFGTHILDLAKMGARCRKITYFQSSMSSEALSYGSSNANSKSSSYSGSASASGSGFGISVSASASFSQSSSNSYQQSSESSSELSSETEYSSETLDCVGEVDVTTICGDMLGTKNQPSLVGYRMKRIWDLPIFDEYPIAKQYILTLLANISDSGIECGINNCGGLGMCGIDESFWTLLKYKDWTVNTTFESLWDPKVCFDQYQVGTSLLPQGDDMSIQMNQCNNASIVNWGERYESSQISFDPFCSNEYGIQVALGLNLVNLSVSFEVKPSLVTDYGFSITYGLLSTGDYVCTSIGGVSYALFCENTNVRVTTVTVEAEYILVEDAKNWTEAEQHCISEYNSHLATIFNDDTFDNLTHDLNDTYQYWIGLNLDSTWHWSGNYGVSQTGDWLNADNWHTGYPNGNNKCAQITYDINDASQKWGFVNAACYEKHSFLCNKNSIVVTTDPILSCKDNVNTEAIAAINGYNYKKTSINGIYTDFEQYTGMGIYTGLTTSNSSFVELEYDAVGGSLSFDISIIHFCYDTSSIRFGVEEFLINKDVTFNAPYIKRKWIQFDPPLQCTAVNIWVGFSYFDGYNACSNAVWTENTKGGGGFTLVVASWETREDDDIVPVCARGANAAQCNTYTISRKVYTYSNLKRIDHSLCNLDKNAKANAGCSSFTNSYRTEVKTYFYAYRSKGLCVGITTTIDTTIYVYFRNVFPDLDTRLTTTPGSVDGYEYVGILGHCSKNDPNDGHHVELVEFYDNERIDHLYTISETEKSNLKNPSSTYSYTYKGPLCYVRKDTIPKSEITSNVHVSWFATCQKF